MKKGYLFAIIIFLLFIGCNKNDKQSDNKKNNKEVFSNEVAKKFQFLNNFQIESRLYRDLVQGIAGLVRQARLLNISDNRVDTGKFKKNYEPSDDNNKIDYLVYDIFTSLNIKWVYSNLEELFSDLNISDNFSMEENVIENTLQSGEEFLHLFDIEYENYIINIYAYSNNPDFIGDPVLYYLYSIEIELNDTNLLDLFPYKNIESYMEDDDFGYIIDTDSEDGIISYLTMNSFDEEDSIIGYSDLIFSNGILKSIKINRFFT
jgi:hypothetical protein